MPDVRFPKSVFPYPMSHVLCLYMKQHFAFFKPVKRHSLSCEKINYIVLSPFQKVHFVTIKRQVKTPKMVFGSGFKRRESAL